jgi:hypothetical protein
MDEGAQLAEPAASPGAMLDQIESGAGHWHELAKLFPALHAAGVDGGVVEERTGVERKLQNLWTGASQIYDSLKAGGAPPSVLEYYDRDGGECLLYELRFLSIQQRLSAAEYMARQELEPREALILAKAVKEHERRVGGKEGFSASPGDCLAYKHYRDVSACRAAAGPAALRAGSARLLPRLLCCCCPAGRPRVSWWNRAGSGVPQAQRDGVVRQKGAGGCGDRGGS